MIGRRAKLAGGIRGRWRIKRKQGPVNIGRSTVLIRRQRKSTSGEGIEEEN